MDTEEFLEHYGVKGMQWGVRREQKKELRSLNNANKSAEKAAIKGHRKEFKQEVALTRKHKGITFDPKSVKPAQKTNSGLMTARINADFKNSKGEKVSIDFANAVLSKAVSKNQREAYVKVGAVWVAAMLAGKYIGNARMSR